MSWGVFSIYLFLGKKHLKDWNIVFLNCFKELTWKSLWPIIWCRHLQVSVSRSVVSNSLQCLEPTRLLCLWIYICTLIKLAQIFIFQIYIFTKFLFVCLADLSLLREMMVDLKKSFPSSIVFFVNFWGTVFLGTGKFTSVIFLRWLVSFTMTKSFVILLIPNKALSSKVYFISY